MPVITRQAQAYYLGSAQHLAGVGINFLMQGTAQIPLLLEDVILTSQAGFGSVNTITLAGQSMMASDQGMPVQAFQPLAQLEGFRSVSCPINTNQRFEMGGTLVAAADLGMQVSTSPIAPQQYRPTSELGGALNYCFGVAGTTAGNLVAGPGVTTTFVATCLRDCLLGRLVIVNGNAAAVPDDNINITSILVEGIELLSGQQGVDVVNIGAISAACTDLSGLQLNYPISANGQVRITVNNLNAAAGTLGLGIFCLPA
jgi:hypothetical protein|tara:strand:+ start:103 stop:873 length:771 start_codon:yes stop_codon:yes gene_type:complete